MCSRCEFGTVVSLDVIAIDQEVVMEPYNQPALQYRINCIGSEARMSDCAVSLEGECRSNFRAAIVCPPPCENGDLQLYSTVDDHEGLVLLCYEHRWYGICDQLWSTNDAIVTCHNLGYTGVG